MGILDALNPGHEKDDKILYGTEQSTTAHGEGQAVPTGSGPTTGTTPMHTTTNPSTSSTPAKHDKHDTKDAKEEKQDKPRTIDRIKSVFSRKKHDEPEQTSSAADTKTTSSGPYTEKAVEQPTPAQSSTAKSATAPTAAAATGLAADNTTSNTTSKPQTASAGASVASIKSGIPGQATTTTGVTDQATATSTYTPEYKAPAGATASSFSPISRSTQNPTTTTSTAPTSTATTTHAPTVTTTTTSSIPTSSNVQTAPVSSSTSQATHHAGRDTALAGAGAGLAGGALAAGAASHHNKDTADPASQSRIAESGNLGQTPSSTTAGQSTATTGSGLTSSVTPTSSGAADSSVSNINQSQLPASSSAHSPWVQSIIPGSQPTSTSTNVDYTGRDVTSATTAGAGLAGGVAAAQASHSDKDQTSASSQPLSSSTNFSRPTPTTTVTGASSNEPVTGEGAVGSTYTARSYALPSSTHDPASTSYPTPGNNLAGNFGTTPVEHSSTTGLGSSTGNTTGTTTGVGSIGDSTANTDVNRGSLRRLDSEPLGIPGSFPAETPLSEQPPAVAAATTAYIGSDATGGLGSSTGTTTSTQPTQGADHRYGRDAAIAGGSSAAVIGAATAWKRHEGGSEGLAQDYTDSIGGGAQPYASHGLDPRVDSSSRTGPLSREIDQSVSSANSHGRDPAVAQGTPALSQTAESAPARSADPTLSGQISGSTADNLHEPTLTGSHATPSDAHHGRDAAIAGGLGAGAAAAGVGAYEHSKPKDDLPVEKPTSTTSSTIPPGSSTHATSATTSNIPASTSTTNQSQSSEHHYGRDAAIAGGVGGATAAGVGAYEYSKPRDDLPVEKPTSTPGSTIPPASSTTAHPTTTTQSTAVPSSTSAAAVPSSTTAQTSSKQHPNITASPLYDPSRPRSSDNDPEGPESAKDKSSYAQNIGAGVAGAGLGATGAHAYNEHQKEPVSTVPTSSTTAPTSTANDLLAPSTTTTKDGEPYAGSVPPVTTPDDVRKESNTGRNIVAVLTGGLLGNAGEHHALSSKESTKETTPATTVAGTQKPDDVRKESNGGRNAVAALTGGLLGNAGEQHAFDSNDSHKTVAPESTTAGASRSASTATGAQQPTTSTAATSHPTSSTVTGSDGAADSSHTGRNAAIGAGAVGAGAATAGAFTSPQNHRDYTQKGVFDPSATPSTTTSAAPTAGTGSHSVTGTGATASAAPTTSTTTAPTTSHTQSRFSEASEDDSHTGRNLAAGSAAGAGVGAAGAYAYDQHARDSEAERLKGLEKQHEKDAKEAEKLHKKEEKATEKEAAKEEKKHEKEVAKEEKKHEKEVAKEEKKHEKEVAKEEKKQEKVLAKEQEKHEKAVAKEEEKRRHELEKDEKERRKAAEKAEKENAKKEKGGLLGFLHKDKSKDEKNPEAEKDDSHTGRNAAAGTAAGAAAGAGAYTAYEHHSRDPASTTGATTTQATQPSTTVPAGSGPLATSETAGAGAPGQFVSPQNHRDYTQQGVFDPSAPQQASATQQHSALSEPQPDHSNVQHATSQAPLVSGAAAGTAAAATQGEPTRDTAQHGLDSSQTQHSVTSDASGDEKKKGGLRSLFSRNKGDRPSGEYERERVSEDNHAHSPTTTAGAYAHHEGRNKLHKDPPKDYYEKHGVAASGEHTALGAVGSGSTETSGYRGTAAGEQHTVTEPHTGLPMKVGGEYGTSAGGTDAEPTIGGYQQSDHI